MIDPDADAAAYSHSICLTLDHVQVECRNHGDVVVTAIDSETQTLMMWVMRPSVDDLGGWAIETASCPLEDQISPTIN